MEKNVWKYKKDTFINIWKYKNIQLWKDTNIYVEKYKCGKCKTVCKESKYIYAKV